MSAIVDPGQILQGIAIAGIGLLLLQSTWEVLWNLERHGEVSLALKFPSGRVDRGLKVLVLGFILYSAGMAAGSVLLSTEMDGTLYWGARLLVLAGMLSFLYFLRAMVHVTRNV